MYTTQFHFLLHFSSLCRLPQEYRPFPYLSIYIKTLAKTIDLGLYNCEHSKDKKKIHHLVQEHKRQYIEPLSKGSLRAEETASLCLCLPNSISLRHQWALRCCCHYHHASFSLVFGFCF